MTTTTLLLAVTIGSYALEWSGTVNLTSNVTDDVTLTGNTTLYVPGTVTVSGVISGNYSLTKTGAGKLTLNGANTYTGETQIDNGTLALGANGTIANSSRVYFSGVGTFDISAGNQAIKGLQCLNSNSVVALGTRRLSIGTDRENDGGGTYAGKITGSAPTNGDAISKSGSATLTLTGTASTYTGTTNIYEGTINFSSLANFGNSTLFFSTSSRGGALQWASGNSADITPRIYLNRIFGSNNLTFDIGDNNVTFATAIQGVNMFTKKGTGRLTLTAANSANDSLTVSTGELYVGNGGTTGSVTGNISVASGAVLGFSRSNNYEYSGIISGAGSVYKSGTGKLTLNGVNTYTGETQINVGTLALGASSSISTSSRVYFNNVAAATFDISAGEKTIRGLQSTDANDVVALGTNRLIIGTFSESDGGGTYAGKITGTAIASDGAIRKHGSATLTLTGTESTYTGTTIINEGTINFSSLANFGNSTLNCYGGTLQWASGNTADITPRLYNNQIGSSNFTFDVGTNNVTFATYLQGTNMFTKNGTGRLTLTAANTATGAITISAGELYVGNGGTTGSVTGNISVGSGAIFGFQRSNDYEYSGIISGAGNVQKAGTGKLTLNAANTYTGDTRIAEGTLALGASGTIATSSRVFFNYTAAATFDISAGNQTIKGLESTDADDKMVLGSSTLTINNTDDNTFAGVISGTGGITKTGAGILMLRAANTATGALTISEGTLGIGGSAGSVTGNISVASGAICSFYRSSDFTYSGIISGAGTVRRAGSGTLTLNGANTYTGETQIYNGTLALGASGTIANSSRVVFVSTSDATFDISVGDKTVKGLVTDDAGDKVVLGSHTLTINNTDDNTFNGIIEGTGGITKTGAGTLILNGTNTYTGVTTISAGTLTLRDNLASSGIVNNATLRFEPTSDSPGIAYDKVISGTGTVVQAGSGTTTLDRVNTYTGETQILEGMFALGTIGTIENSSRVYFNSDAAATFDISTSYNPITIRGLQSTNTNDVVALGTNPLVIGTYSGSDGGGTYAGKITGSTSENNAAIRKLGSATLTLTGTESTYTGTTDIHDGVLNFSSLANFGKSILYCVEGTLQWASGNTEDVSARLYLNCINGSNVNFDIGANNVIFANAITGNNMFTKKGAGRLTLTAANEAIGTMTVSAGELYVGNGGTTGSITGNIRVADGATLVFERSNNYGYSSVISGTGDITKTGAGTLTLNGANTATGRLTLSAGTLALAGNWAGTLTQAADTELTVTGNRTVGGVLTLQGGTVNLDLTAAQPSKLTATGVLSASGNTALNVKAATATGQTLIQAAGGVSIAPFTLTLTGGASGVLGGNATALTLNVPTGIDTIDAQALKIWVENGELRMENAELRIGETIAIYDLSGHTVETWRATSLQDQSINVSHLPNGIYIVRVGGTTTKVVIQ
jgi:autotransporter-associated beta strand protein